MDGWIDGWMDRQKETKQYTPTFLYICVRERITSETALYYSLMIPQPQVDNFNNVKLRKCSVNRKMLSDESENASHGIADLYKP